MNPLADPNTFLIVVFTFITLSYIATCAIWPFKACRRCHGSGRLRSPLIKAIRLCPNCEATGLRIRLGRHAWNTFARLHRKNRRDRNRR